MSQRQSSPEQTEPADRGPRIPAVGERIGKYVVLAPIGSGAMGVVVRAYDPHLERQVAIKVVRPRELDAERSEAARARLLVEARALARISHPNVVGVYEVGLQDALIFVAMELVDGVDLEHWLREQPRSWRAIVDAFEAAGRGLAQVHAAGLVHRDVKPANILVGDDARVRIGDFGIARASFELPAPSLEGQELDVVDFDLETTALTAEGRVVGTPTYMAPEQHLGLEVGPAADQYALCVGLYEALWRKRPFAVDARRLLAAKRAGPIELIRRDVPRWLFAVVARGLAPDPGARFASMTELCAALRDDPSLRRRRRIAWAAGGVAVVGASLAIVRLASRPGPCEQSDAALAGAWDSTTRDAVEHAFAASERPWAAPAWEHAGPRLDDYAAQWTAMRRDACEASHVRGEQSPELLDRRMACLETRRRQLAATTELLAAGEDSAIDHTFELLGHLRPIEPCGDAVALASAVELPDDETLRAAVDGVRTELARARALVDAGRYAEGAELAHTITATARELDHAPVLAEALGFEGEALVRMRPDDARGLLEEALWTAIGVGHDEVAADAASNLVWLAGYERALPEALRWAELAKASLRRGGREDPLELVQLDNALGVALGGVARYDESLQAFDRALARIADDPNFVSRAASLRSNSAKIQVDRGDLDRARAILEPTIVELAAVLGSDHPRVVTMRGALGQVYGAAGDDARAIELFSAEIDGLRVAMGDDALVVAYARMNLGVALARVGRSDESIAVGEVALASFERAGDDSGAANCLSNLGSEYFERGIYDAAQSRFERSAKLFEAIYPDGHPDLLYPLVGLGRVHAAQGRHAEALASYQRADRSALASESPSGHARGLALEGMATALTHLDRRPEALAVLAEEIAVFRQAGDIEPDELPMALEHHAQVLCAVGRFDDALREVDEALALARTHGLDHVTAMGGTERACALEGLGRRGDARRAAATALAVAERIEPADPSLLAELRGTVARLDGSR